MNFWIPIARQAKPVSDGNSQRGSVLIELIVAIVLMGVVLPSVFSLIASVSINSVRNGIREQAVSLAATKLEEVIGRKSANWDWYKNPELLESDENLADGFQRVVTLTPVANWGNGNISGWEASVVVTHPHLPEGFIMSVRLTVYSEQ
jgi:type II secretory pathway pseudopilin PulG